MANNAPTIRKNINKLDNPLELRELNRQLEWLWKKLLGNLDDKAFADGTIRNIVTTVENQVVETIESGSIETSLLNAAIARMMVAVIGICDADYLGAVDIDAEQLLVRDGYGEDFSFRNLKVLYTQIASATISELCIKASDGNFYYIDVDSLGNVSATPVDIADDEISAGITDSGKVILETEITADELNTSSLLATYALINKIRADEIDVMHLFAREAFVAALTTSQIFANGGTLQMIAEDTRENNEDISTLSSRFEQTTEAFELSLSEKVGEDTLKQYLRYEDGTVEMGSSESRYKLQANNTGVTILQDGQVMTRMQQNTVAAPVIEAERMLKIGTHTAKVSASGALVFN